MFILAFLVATSLTAATPPDAHPDAPGLDVADRCMAQGLRGSGFTGVVRVRLTQAADRSLETCDAEAAAKEVFAFKVTARPCLGMALRQYGYVGRLFTPAGMTATPQEAACEAGGARLTQSELATFRRADGLEITTMRPVPNPEDMPREERRRVYGYW
ncbi:MAG: hypothetical protein V4514_07005 [Pseudomonadota bacterium]|uniref:hypothetical protein n=1 Tax=Phenylobacterium sp. TaxID=1871053 RepID=UPI0025DE8DBD|nr:hypothetical protein [Phenylobacterium sp.]MBT9471744.1 hypothetical protein [Phenylobacterium sp.]